MAAPIKSAVIRQYGGRRPYHCGEGRYLPPVGLARMIKDAEDLAVHDAGTGSDITGAVLKKIIREQAWHG